MTDVERKPFNSEYAQKKSKRQAQALEPLQNEPTKFLWCISQDKTLVIMLAWMLLQAAGAVIESFYFPGAALYLHVLSDLPAVAFLITLIKNNGNMRYLSYILYTVCVVLSVLIGSLGPWVLGGRYWNNECMDEVINGKTGKYVIDDRCVMWNIFENC